VQAVKKMRRRWHDTGIQAHRRWGREAGRDGAKLVGGAEGRCGVSKLARDGERRCDTTGPSSSEVRKGRCGVSKLAIDGEGRCDMTGPSSSEMRKGGATHASSPEIQTGRL
jgi:hypothetical protein